MPGRSFISGSKGFETAPSCQHFDRRIDLVDCTFPDSGFTSELWHALSMPEKFPATSYFVVLIGSACQFDMPIELWLSVVEESDLDPQLTVQSGGFARLVMQ